MIPVPGVTVESALEGANPGGIGGSGTGAARGLAGRLGVDAAGWAVRTGGIGGRGGVRGRGVALQPIRNTTGKIQRRGFIESVQPAGASQP